ncbi:hypothetical protein [Mesorhizobium ciceri]|uniref:hypothetical protein n=1 Tax=Mesorhizobium TaxID=68287 RepID=UPI00047DE787|nr:hypothetical protein [Mesorhizobium ciceri]
MSSEDEAMLSIRVDKRPISQAQLIGFVVILMGQAFVGGGLYYKFTSDIANAASKADLATLSVKVDSESAARQARSVLSDRNFDDIQNQLKPLDTVSLRLDQNDKRDDAQDARIDRMLELIGAKLDTLTQNVADVKADVRVVAQDVKNLGGKTQPTSFRP